MRHWLFLSSFILCGCATVPAHYSIQHTIPVSCQGTDADISVVTYNLAIAPGINILSSARTPRLVDAIQQELRGNDVLCLQEVWPYETLERIAASFRHSHPHAFSADTRGEGETGLDRCGRNEVEDMLSCARRQCAGVPAEDATICALRQCATSFRKMHIFEWIEKRLFGRNTSCFNCLVASVGKSIGEIERACVNSRSGDSKVYGGANGVMLLSRYPLFDAEEIRLPSSGANRVALLARVELPRGQVELACTHLSSNEPVSPMHPAFATWNKERGTQFGMIADRMVARAKDDTPMLIIGDMNFGPGRGPDISPYGEANWEEAVQRGFASAVVLAETPLATFPAGNMVSRSPDSFLVDHALFQPEDAIAPVCAELVFTKPVRIGGAWTNLSDHVGVRAKFRLKPS